MAPRSTLRNGIGSLMALAWAFAGLASVSLCAWVYLSLFRGMFWRVDFMTDWCTEPLSRDDRWPSVAVILPARNEAETLPKTLPTLLGQQYAGDLRVVVVDDNSDDGTAAAARSMMEREKGGERLTVVTGRRLPAGWSGKLWALDTGLEVAMTADPDFVLFTDADISHPTDGVRRLVEHAIGLNLDMVSVMARLKVSSATDRILIPAFVYFFAKLYPFRWSSDPNSDAAAAAGGCILLRPSSLARAGGLEAISDALIDDCALARSLKRSGSRIWLGLEPRIFSVRDSGSVNSVWDMVARTAYAQLGYSLVALVGTVLAMLVIYIVPPASIATGGWLMISGNVASGAVAVGSGALAWSLMAATFRPMLRFYGVGPLVAPALSAAGLFFTLFTVASATRSWRGKGGKWRGRSLPPRL